jgi:hypothetical protein
MGQVRKKTNGIKYYMHNRNEHNLPHLHVHHGSDEAKIRIDNQEVIEGSLRPEQLAEAQAWIRLKRNKLLKMWKRRMEPDGIQVIPE